MGVESSLGHHRCHRRGPQPSRGGPRLRRLPGLGQPAGRRATGPRARPRSSRGRAAHTPVTTAATPTDGRSDHRAAQRTGRAKASTPGRTPSPGTCTTTTASRCRGPRSTATCAPPGWSSRHPRSDPRPPTSASRPSSPTRAGKSDFTHYRLTGPRRPGTDVEILVLARRPLPLRPLGHRPPPRHRTRSCSTPSAKAVAHHGIPASTLTDNGMVFTTRCAGGRGGRNGFEAELRRLRVTQKNSRPNHPTTCGKVERFQQTMKSGSRPTPPADHHRPSCRPCSTPSSTNTTTTARTAPCRTGPPPPPSTPPDPKPSPADRDPDTHDRVRHDRVDKAGSRHPARQPAASTTSASAEPTPEPTSSCSSTTSTSASSTPPPANSSANSPSTPPGTTNPERPPAAQRKSPEPKTQVQSYSYVLRHHTSGGGGI